MVNYGFNTQPRGGGCRTRIEFSKEQFLFQHTAAWRRLPPKMLDVYPLKTVSTHSRVEAAAIFHKFIFKILKEFQHTAAWRRLPFLHDSKKQEIGVSTHSRVEAAAVKLLANAHNLPCFNTQPRGGGCLVLCVKRQKRRRFQHTAAWRRLPTVR